MDEEDDITCRVESEIKDPKIADAVKSMEDELSATSISESFEKGACQRQVIFLLSYVIFVQLIDLQTCELMLDKVWDKSSPGQKPSCQKCFFSVKK